VRGEVTKVVPAVCRLRVDLPLLPSCPSASFASLFANRSEHPRISRVRAEHNQYSTLQPVNSSSYGGGVCATYNAGREFSIRIVYSHAGPIRRISNAHICVTECMCAGSTRRSVKRADPHGVCY